jgi:translation elongation factor EF-G
LEVINIARESNIPIIVALNKIDVLGADPEETEKLIYEKTGLKLETYGGNIPVLLN